jgi:hypothetical protein
MMDFFWLLFFSACIRLIFSLLLFWLMELSLSFYLWNSMMC